MTLLLSAGAKKFKYPAKHDKDELKYYSIAWRPKIRLNSKEYLLDDVVVPSTANGFCYVCTNPGLSAASTPTMSTVIDGTTVDGTVEWTARPYDMQLNTGDTIETSTWIPSTGVTVDNQGIDQGVTWCRVTAVPTDATTFELTNRVAVLRLDGKHESYDRTLVITIATL